MIAKRSILYLRSASRSLLITTGEATGNFYSFSNSAGSALHSMGKLNEIYYGMHLWPDGVTDDGLIFAGLNAAYVDHIDIAFNVGSSLNTACYNTIISNCALSWGFQFRSYDADNGQDGTLSSQLQFISTQFNGKVPVYYSGGGMWFLYSPEDYAGFTSAEWTNWESWTYIGIAPLVTSTPTPTPMSGGGGGIGTSPTPTPLLSPKQTIIS